MQSAGSHTVGTAELFIAQEMSAYTAEDHQVWRTLFERRYARLRQTASQTFLEGMERIGLRADCVPSLADMNARLHPMTGWQAVPVSGFLAPHVFFRCLAERRFPTTVRVRPAGQLDYTPEPDIFHDVFGHVPMHADPVFADYLQRFGNVAASSRSEEELELVGRIFWYTVEFGLVRERGQVRLYGSGLISSIADAENALSDGCEHRPFRLKDVLAQPVKVDEIQRVLFVVESFAELFSALDEFKEQVARRGGEAGIPAS